MARNTRLTARGMVCYILQAHPGVFLSVNQIREKISEKFATTVHRQTVFRALDELLFTLPDLEEQTARRGHLNLPVKTFSIIKKNATCLE